MLRYLLLLFTCCGAVTLSAQDNVTFDYVGEDDFFFCVADSTQTIQITPDPARTLTELSIVWILGTTQPVVITDPTDLTHTFTYPTSSLLDNCNYPAGGGLQFTTQVFATYDDSPNPENVSRTVTFRKPPQLIISGAGTYCVGQTANLSARLCPNNDPTAQDLIWSLPDGSEVRNQNNISFDLDAPGTYTFRLSNQNDCGSGQTSATVTVIEAPTALAVADSNVIVVDENNYRICFESGTRDTIRINSNGSTGLTSRSWTSSSGNVRILDNDGITSRVEIRGAGTYTLRLRGRNQNCNLTAEDEFTLEVIETAVLNLTPQLDECISLDYTPTPFNNEATYEVDGMVVTSFPITLSVGQHTVLATLPPNDVCPTLPLTDTFFVSPEETASIATPDTTVCDRASTIVFEASPGGGNWRINGQTFNGSINPGSRAPGVYTITYGNDPCLTSDTRTLTILGSEVTVPSDQRICVDQGSINFAGQVTPADGVFSGDGVTPEGVFDPAAAGLGTFTITYTYANPADASCGSERSFDVIVEELTASFETGDCTGNQVCFTLPDGTSFDSAEWFVDGLGTRTGPNPCFDFPGQGSYNVRLTLRRGPCGATVTQPITIAPAPSPSFTLQSDPTGCSALLVDVQNTSGGGGDLNYNWLLNGETFSTDASPDPLLLESITQDSTFEISLVLGNACEENATPGQIITTRPRAVARFGSDLDSYCSGDTLRLSNNSFGGVTGYAWTLDGVPVSADSLPPVLAIESDVVRTVELCLSAENTCNDSLFCEQLTITPTDVEALFNSSATTICAGDTLRLTNLATNGAAVRYDFGNGQISTANNPVVVYETPGSYTIRQRAFGCGSDVFSRTVMVTGRPTAAFSAAVGCPGVPVQFTNESDPGLRSTWDFGDDSAGSEEYSPKHIFANPGSYEVCLTVRPLTPGGCPDVSCRTVEIAPAPVADFMAPDSVCAGSEAEFTSLADSDLGCQYRFGDGNVAANCSPMHTYMTAGLYSVTQIVGDARGCRDSVVRAVNVRPLPEPIFLVPDGPLCNPATLTFTNTTPTADSYEWDFDNDATATITNPSTTFTEAGDYNISLTATTEGICRATTTQTVTIEATPDAVINLSDATVCQGEPITATSDSEGTISNLRWSFGDGRIELEDEAIEHTYASDGNFTITLVADNAGRCFDTTTAAVTVYPAVDARIVLLGALRCNGDANGILGARFSAGEAPYSFTWSDGSFTSVNPNLSAGAYQLTVTDANGCRQELMDTLREPAALVSASEVATVTCFGGSDGSIDLAASGGTAPYQITWPGGSADGTINDLSAGDYPITITDANDCSVETDILVPENPEVVVDDSLTQISCFGAMDGALTLLNVGGGVGPYTINLTGTDYFQEGSTLSRFDNLLPDIYTFSVSDALGCGYSTELEITEPDEVTLDILADTVQLSLGESAILNTRFNAADPVWRWTPGVALSCTDCPTPEVRPFDPLTDYVASITDANNCSASDTVTVVVDIDREVYIPNTFTPNQDGRNDLFRVRSRFVAGIESIESFQVFDRWGQVVFEEREFAPNDPAFGWDGRKGGEMVQLGVYVYQVVVRYVDGEKVVLSGQVELLR